MCELTDVSRGGGFNLIFFFFSFSFCNGAKHPKHSLKWKRSVGLYWSLLVCKDPVKVRNILSFHPPDYQKLHMELATLATKLASWWNLRLAWNRRWPELSTLLNSTKLNLIWSKWAKIKERKYEDNVSSACSGLDFQNKHTFSSVQIVLTTDLMRLSWCSEIELCFIFSACDNSEAIWEAEKAEKQRSSQSISLFKASGSLG